MPSRKERRNQVFQFIREMNRLGVKVPAETIRELKKSWIIRGEHIMVDTGVYIKSQDRMLVVSF